MPLYTRCSTAVHAVLCRCTRGVVHLCIVCEYKKCVNVNAHTCKQTRCSMYYVIHISTL